MKVTVDRQRCIGAGMCLLTAPAVFDQDEDDGTVVLLDAEPPPGAHEAVREAVQSCPAAAITADDR
ncbi:ferredoxin [Nocardia wallacei]|uniref:ferredoxin n=1 Tax=Nocardia wallacei TaxID=480035 RepID=UPI002458D148|nr:ferredoxin [Nocardia wallacei]